MAPRPRGARFGVVRHASARKRGGSRTAGPGLRLRGGGLHPDLAHREGRTAGRGAGADPRRARMTPADQRRPGSRRRITELPPELQALRLERAVLVGLSRGRDGASAESSLEELKRLAETAGAEVLEAVLHRRDTPDPATFIGKGKAQEVRDIVR